MEFMTELGTIYKPEYRLKYDGTRCYSRGESTCFLTRDEYEQVLNRASEARSKGLKWKLVLSLNRFGVMVYNHTTGFVEEGNYIIDPVHMDPEIGLYPVDVGNSYFHIGRQIISMSL